ncbi:MAG: hypothetical protein A2201_00430, partial [Alicyclobacillus sp. RIFOXYA1_FULL_53_8]
MDGNEIEIRPLVLSDLGNTVTLHQSQLATEFISRFGKRFLKRYYQAFADSPYAFALVAVETTTNQVVGALLGTVRASAHYRYMTRQCGWRLASLVVLQAILHPSLALEVCRTRAKRYLGGLFRHAVAALRKSQGENVVSFEQVGDLTHLVVDPSRRSQGIGSQLVQAYEFLAWQANVERIDLVTLPRQLGGAGDFY